MAAYFYCHQYKLETSTFSYFNINLVNNITSRESYLALMIIFKEETNNKYKIISNDSIRGHCCETYVYTCHVVTKQQPKLLIQEVYCPDNSST